MKNLAQRVPRERLLISLRRGDLRGVTSLFHQRPEMCNALDEQCNNAMHISAKCGNIDIVQFLLQQDGYGPYHLGGYGPYQVRLDEQNCQGLTPLQVAERNGFSEVAELIRQQEAAREERAKQIRDEEGARKIEEAKRAEIIAATTKRTLKELELQGKRHYAICKKCGTAHEKPAYRPEEAGEPWYCKACGSCLGRYDGYDGGTVVSLTPRFPRL
ncbi:MAG: ankyrin repeat domain-containing protein [Roseiarcus sp.]